MRRTFVKIAYVGFAFHGYQYQPHVSTVEGIIKKAIRALKKYDETIEYRGAASRTDTGVSAISNVIAIDSQKEIWPALLNGHLESPYVKSWAFKEVERDRKPRHSIGKVYTYFWPYLLFKDEERPSLTILQERAKVFEGTRNFRHFCKRDERNPVRTVEEIKIMKENNGYRLRLRGRSFVWQQVRRIAMAIFGLWKELSIAELEEALTNPEKELKTTIRPAPGEGLILEEIRYEDDQVNPWNMDQIAQKGITHVFQGRTIQQLQKADSLQRLYNFFAEK